MTTWSLAALIEAKPKFTECLGDSQEEARVERWTSVDYARKVWVQAGEKGAFTKAHRCTACPVVPKDDVVCFLARNISHRSTGRKSLGIKIHCAFCGSQSKAKERSCVVSVQCHNSLDSCLVFLGGVPSSPLPPTPLPHSSPGHYKKWLEASIMGSSAHRPGGKVRALENSRSETMSKLAEVWYEWLLVEQWKMVRHRSRRADRGKKSPVPRRWPTAFTHTKLFSLWVKVADGHKGRRTIPGIPLSVARAVGHQSPRWTGTGWFKMAEVPTVEELRSMSARVKKANLGVKQHGITGCTESGGEKRRTKVACRGRLIQGSWWTLCTSSLVGPWQSGRRASRRRDDEDGPEQWLK